MGPTTRPNKTILSLCDFTGNWSRPYAEAGYRVVLADLKRGQDLRFLRMPEEPIHGILAAPPCTVFTCSGQWVDRDRAEIGRGLALVDACLRFVAVCKPKWWALENPVGTLRSFLGKPRLIFHPYHFGDPYKKRTCLWGDFNIPEMSPVEPRRDSAYGSWLMNLSGGSERHRELRAATPQGFSRAFFRANP